MTISPHPQPQESLIFSLDLTELLQHCDGPEAEPKWIYFRWMLTPSGDPLGSKYIMIPPGKNESADPEIETQQALLETTTRWQVSTCKNSIRLKHISYET